MDGTQFNGCHFIVTHNTRFDRDGSVESVQAFLLGTEGLVARHLPCLGTLKVESSSFKIIRSVSILILCTALTARMFSRSFPGYRRVMGRPMSFGGERAILTISVLISGTDLTGRPMQVRYLNKERPSRLNRRISSLIYSSCKQMPLAISCTV